MKNIRRFLDSFFEQINEVGIDISTYDLDHIAYQASSSDDYNKHKIEFSKIGKEVSEKIIGNRRVAIFKLNNPIKYKKYLIPVLELIEQKENQECNSQFQHAEFIVDMPFENYISKYPRINWDKSSMNRSEFSHLKLNFKNGLTLKFLKQPILEILQKK